MKLKTHYYILIILIECLSVEIKAHTLKDSTQVNELNQAIMEYVYRNTSKAKAIGFQSLDIAREIGFKKGEGIALSRIGIAYDVENSYDSAIYFYFAALKINRSIGYKKGEGSALCNLGLAYLHKNDYPNSLRYLQAAIKPLSEINAHEYLGNCYNNIALMFLEMDNYRKAISYFKLAEAEYLIAKNDYQIAIIYSNMAMVHTENRQFDSAILLEGKALPYFEKDSDYYNLAKCYNNLGIDYKMKDDYKQAEKYYLLSIEYAKKYKGKDGLADTYFNLATNYSKMNKYEESEKYAQLAMDMLPTITSRKIKSDLFFLYGQIKMRQGDYKSASKLFVDAKWQNDSFFKIESAELISKAETRFGLERKENENRQLMQKNQIQLLELENKTNEVQFRKKINTVIIILSVLIIGLIIMVLRRRLQVQKLLSEQRLKAEQQRQRVQISHELHDNVGAQLSYIVSNMNVLQEQHPEDKRLGSISAMSKQAIVTLRETVWALNNESISLLDFSDKFKQYTSKILDFNPEITCSIKENFGSNSILQPLQALNLFRICQEAFSNAIHHSKAKHIVVEFSNGDKSFFDVRIMDDGIGFDQEEAQLKGHYGLLTMRSRAEELGAKFHIESRLGEGTSVRFTLEKT